MLIWWRFVECKCNFFYFISNNLFCFEYMYCIDLRRYILFHHVTYCCLISLKRRALAYIINWIIFKFHLMISFHIYLTLIPYMVWLNGNCRILIISNKNIKWNMKHSSDICLYYHQSFVKINLNFHFLPWKKIWLIDT